MPPKINIAVILSAVDQMSSVVAKSVSSSISQLNKFKSVSGNLQAFGAKSMAVGAAAAAPVIGFAKTFGDQEAAMLQMKAEMLQDGNKFNSAMFKQLGDFAQKSTDTYGGTAEAYLKMIRVLRENSIDPKEILGGIGDAVEQLSVAFEMQPEKIGQFAARMRQDMGVTSKEMIGMMDLIARLKNAGVGKDGEEAVNEMSEAFSKAGLGAHNLGVTGLQASKDLGALMGIFIRRGITGSTVGNNFRRIFDGLRDAEKLKKSNDIAKEFGITLDFYDKNHQFKGIANFTGELGKLKGLNTTQIASILKPFGGKQGLSTDFLEFLGKEGVESINDFNKKLYSQGTLSQKVAVIMSGLNRQFDRTHSAVTNAAADIGSTYAPELKELLTSINQVIKSVRGFINEHRSLTKYIALSVGTFGALAFTIGGVSLGLSGVVKIGAAASTILGGLGKVALLLGQGMLYAGAWIGRLGLLLLTRGIPAMATFTATVWANAAAWMANPATWIILAIIAAVAALVAIGVVVYNNWDKILTWFSDKWIVLKAAVSGMISVFRLFLDVIVGVGKALIGLWTFNPKMMIEGAKQAANAVSAIANGGISKAFASGVNESLKNSNATINKDGDVVHFGKKSAPVGNSSASMPKPLTQKGGTTYNVNLNGVKTDDPKAMADQFTKFIKQHRAKEARLGY